MDIALPKSIRTSMLNLQEANGTGKKSISYVDAAHDGDNSNRIELKVDGLKLTLEAVTATDDTTSTYSKQFKLPKGTDTEQISYRIDQTRHLLIVEAPFRSL